MFLFVFYCELLIKCVFEPKIDLLCGNGVFVKLALLPQLIVFDEMRFWGANSFCENGASFTGDCLLLLVNDCSKRPQPLTSPV